MNRSLFHTIGLIVLIAFLLSACSGKDDPVTPSDLSQTDNPAVSTSPNHYIWGYYLISVDLESESVELLPYRQTANHWNVLKFLEQGPCFDCVKVTGISDAPSGAKNIDIQIIHPFTQPNLTGFDVRGIAMFMGSEIFPLAGVSFSDLSNGDGELLNADGYTTLYNYTSLGAGPGGLHGYTEGKFATSAMPTATLNGYIRHVTDDIANTRNAFYSADSVTRTYEIKLPQATKFVLGYAVDASWVPPTTVPVTDPMHDFPPSANCPEPWKIEAEVDQSNGYLTDSGNQTRLLINVYDYQGSSSHAGPVVECPDLFEGTLAAEWMSDGAGFSSWQVSVVNEEFAPVGFYDCLISVEDNQNTGSPEWLDLTAYKIVPLEVQNGGWVRTWGADQYDQAWSVAVDVDGSVYVTGKYTGTVDFDPGDGTDEHTMEAAFDSYLTKFNSEGDFLWAKTWGDSNWDEGLDLAIDSEGNVYVAGYFNTVIDFDPGIGVDEHNSNGDWDAYITKFNPDGDHLWAHTWGGGMWDHAYGVACDGADNVYVCGYFRGSCDFDPGPGDEIKIANPAASYLTSLDSSGMFRWVRVWDGDGAYDDLAYDVTVNGLDEVYVVGTFDGSCDFMPGAGSETYISDGLYQDCYLVKYNTSGTYGWARVWGGTWDDHPFSVISDSTGNAYVTGNFGQTVDFDPGPEVDEYTAVGQRDAYLTVFNPDGDHVWVRTWGTDSLYGSHNDDGRCVEVDGNSRVYVSGFFYRTVDFDPGAGVEERTAVDQSDAFVSVFDKNGDFIRVDTWGGADADGAYGIGVDDSGLIFTAGHFYETVDFNPGSGVENHMSNGMTDAYLMMLLPFGGW